jgi:hypothetical protein
MATNLLALYDIEATGATWEQGIDGSVTQGIGSPTATANYWKPTTPSYQGLNGRPNGTPYSAGTQTYGPEADPAYAPTSDADYDMGHYW